MTTACGRALAIRQTNIVIASTETAPRASTTHCLTLQRLGTRLSTLGTAQQRDDLVCPPDEPRTWARMAYEPATTAPSRPKEQALKCAPRRDLGRRVEPVNRERLLRAASKSADV